MPSNISPGARRALLLILLLAGVYVLLISLTLLTHRMERYLLPLYPLISLLTVWSMAQLYRRRRLSWILSGLVLTHLAMLWVVHHRPTPWIQDPELAEYRGWMHDQRMPSRAQIAGLRRLVHHPRIDFRELVPAMKRALAASRHRGTLGVTIRFHPGQRVMPDVLMGLKQHIFLFTAQLERRRLLPFRYEEKPPKEPLGLVYEPLLRDARTILVVHDPTLDIHVPGNTHPAMAQEDAEVITPEETIPLRVTLLERQ